VATQPKLDLDVQPQQISRLTSADAVAAFFRELGYDTAKRERLTPEGLRLGETAKTVQDLELLSESDDGFLRVVFGQLRSVTAKARADLVRAFARDASQADYLLVLTSDFDAIEFVLIERESRDGNRPGVTVSHHSFVVPRRWPQTMVRIVRRLTWTMDDGLRQYDKLKSVFDAAHFSGVFFQNRALFADHFLLSKERLQADPHWSDDPGPAFEATRKYIGAARDRIGGKGLADAKQELYDPFFPALGFRPKSPKPSAGGGPVPDYVLCDDAGTPRTVALAYPWQRWLDGPDPNDPDRPDDNPGAAVVTLLERGDAEWAIVTNGKLWRLYSRHAHSRSTNFYEVDAEDALLVSGQTDPNEAFRYFWLFFRLQAFLPVDNVGAHGVCPPDVGADGRPPRAHGRVPLQSNVKCWLDRIAEGSREYAREVEEELKTRVFYDVVPALAQGFLEDRRRRLGERGKPSEEELELVRAGTLTLLYRILFLLYAESRDLLPVREASYYEISLKRLKEEVADVAGSSKNEADEKLTQYGKLDTKLYDRLAHKTKGLFAAMAEGRPAANVPRYNGGLFRLDPAETSDEREAQITRFLAEHKVPEFYLALAIDRLARVEDPRTFSLEFVDYKSLGVRQLGSIYEGLLEFKLKLADEDLAATDRAALGEWIALGETRGGARGRSARRTRKHVRKGTAYLARDNAERKSSGSYYTPDHIVQYIVEHTVGPVLRRKLDALRPEFVKASATFHRVLKNVEADPKLMLGHAAAARWRERRKKEPFDKPQPADFRAYALAEAYNAHRGLVERLFDLKVLDPAMGSGHFLVEAVDFVTDELLHFLNAFPNNPVAAALGITRDSILASLAEQEIEVDDALRRKADRRSPAEAPRSQTRHLRRRPEPARGRIGEGLPLARRFYDWRAAQLPRSPCPRRQLAGGYDRGTGTGRPARQANDALRQPVRGAQARRDRHGRNCRDAGCHCRPGEAFAR
jgi:hypothetical protein